MDGLLEEGGVWVNLGPLNWRKEVGSTTDHFSSETPSETCSTRGKDEADLGRDCVGSREFFFETKTEKTPDDGLEIWKASFDGLTLGFGRFFFPRNIFRKVFRRG